MTEQELKIASHWLERLQSDLDALRERLHVYADAYGRPPVPVQGREETGGKEETEKEKVPHTPYKEKGKEENLKQNKILIDYRTPSGGTPSTGCAVNQSIDPVVSLAQEDVQSVRSGLEPTLAEVEGLAKNVLGIPDWYARWWHRYMTAADWRTNRGERVTRQNWRPLIMTWWRNASGEEREEIRREMCEPKPEAQTEELSDEEANRRFRAEYDGLFQGL